jgi:trimethylamine--corrinoid protein Co-methyltransferase
MPALNAIPNRSFGLKGLEEEDLHRLHAATLEVLEKTGLFVGSREALAVFDAAGARVDGKRQLVRIPSNLVEDAVASAPSKILLAGRDPAHDKPLESGRVYFTNFSEGIEVVDPYSGRRRAPTKADLAAAARTVDYLDGIDVCEKAVGAGDVPPPVAPLHNAESMLANTGKHCCVGPGNGFLLERLVDMAAAVAGGTDRLRRRPLLSFTTCPVSPLQLIGECCDIIIAAARCRAVLNILSMALAGGTAPATLAGTLVIHNAEVLGGLTLSQLVSRGAPVIYGSSTTAMDLKLGTASVGTPECAVISAAVARLARYYALPSYVAGG